ncbi:GTP-binding protein RAD-like [Babylonia areolata]|uniref:GTP-binding protein RAD-like n=1 Tax=Babylonia areolata TaxID=304850 RepID=UPI003FD371DC
MARMNRSAQDLTHEEDWLQLDNPTRSRLHTVSSGSPHWVTGSGSHSRSGSHTTTTTSGGSCRTSPVRCPAALSSPCHSHLSVSPRPHKRTESLKKPRKKTLDLGGELSDDGGIRPRTSSLPTKNTLRRPNLQYLTPPPTCSSRDHDEFYTIRSFVTTSKGQLVNRGDSLRSRSTNSIMSSGSGSMTELTHLSTASSQCSLTQEGSGGAESPPASGSYYTVLMLGSAGVGKSSLTEQFATSEYLGTFGLSIDTYREKCVSLLIDGEESTVNFIDPVVDGDVPGDSVDGFVVVFRIDDRGTFAHATDLLFDLRKTRILSSAVILVANKCDLVRSREVSTEEAKSVAATYDCKYVETSVILNHNVDELLVGIVTQMRLLSENEKGALSKKGRHHGGASGDEAGCYARSRHLLNRLLFRKYPISKSCENLYVL